MSLHSHCYRWDPNGKIRTDLTKWFLAIYLTAHDKRGVSATRISEEIEVTYKTLAHAS